MHPITTSKKLITMNYYQLIKPLLFSIPAETSHNLAISALKNQHISSFLTYPSPSAPEIKTSLWGMEFKSPIGIAAGFDKNGECINSLFNLGCGLVEIGTVTPKPQSGNPKPRLFRLKEDDAIINRLGFNNKGLTHLKENTLKWIRNHKKPNQHLGINIGKNKETINSIEDYKICLEEIFDLADYITINISSPNTPGLRELQKRENLNIFLKKINEIRLYLQDKHQKNTPIVLKIAPDINTGEIRHIGDLVQEHQCSGLIISNTTIKRPDSLKSPNKNESGGLSGPPLFEQSTLLIKQMHKHTKGALPIIGVGGVRNAQEAFKKITAGAHLVQAYSGLIYNGPRLINTINNNLKEILTKNKLSSISEAIGIDT